MLHFPQEGRRSFSADRSPFDMYIYIYIERERARTRDLKAGRAAGGRYASEVAGSRGVEAVRRQAP